MASNPEVFRAIKKVWKSEPTLEGAGVHLRRVFGFHEVPQLDPFLLLDHFKSENAASSASTRSRSSTRSCCSITSSRRTRATT